MKTIMDNIPGSPYSGAAYNQYFGDLKVGVFDIETTGLSPRDSRLILSGFLLLGNQENRLCQFFAESLWDEEEVLLKTLETLSALDAVITYNGRGFDIPFLETRINKLFPDKPMGSPYPLPYNLDLYPLVRKYSDIKAFLPNLKQKTLENFMGLWDHRQDQIDGGQSVAMYQDYLISRDPLLEKQILLHNHDDVLQLSRLLPVLDKTDLHQAMFHQGFPVVTPHYRFIVDRIGFDGAQLCIDGAQQGPLIRHTCFGGLAGCGEGICSWTFSDQQQNFSLKVDTVQSHGLDLVDIRGLGMDEGRYDSFAHAGDGFVAVRRRKQIYYAETNRMITELLERITEEWIQ